ncbi:MAG TPA: hybrid sensor histidine kinase/response regulator [Polyangiaceae bacterium]|jgi:signal transduction histidine kinase
MSERSKHTVKFLLVDDHEENLTALEALLQRDGLELLTARSGDAALELLLKHEVALALVDVHMPDMDGFALAELMRGAERSKRVPIIFLTANPTEQHRIFRGYDAGAVDFLIKPLDARILRHKTDTFFELAQQRMQLAETLRMNETFAASVGHDLKNPLNAMVLTTQLIIQTTTDEAARKHAVRLAATSRRMARIVDDLFDLARARMGDGIPIDRENGDFLAAVRRGIAELEATNPERTIELRHSGGEASGEWDMTRVEQVVSNLVGNALRHGAADGPVQVHLQADADDVVLSVHNDGAIAEEVLPRIFDPFRVGSVPRPKKGGGLGLGLYIVRQIALAHGGTVEIRSNEAEGTTAVVRLRRHAPDSSVRRP